MAQSRTKMKRLLRAKLGDEHRFVRSNTFGMIIESRFVFCTSPIIKLITSTGECENKRM